MSISAINPSLEFGWDIDKSKDIKSLKSIVTDINKIGKYSTINIIQNQDITDKDKYYAIWEENNKLKTIINQIESKLLELEADEEIYNIYVIMDDNLINDYTEFLKQLTESKIKFIKNVETVTTSGGGQFPGRINRISKFNVWEKNQLEFLQLAKKHNIKIL